MWDELQMRNALWMRDEEIFADEIGGLSCIIGVKDEWR